MFFFFVFGKKSSRFWSQVFEKKFWEDIILKKNSSKDVFFFRFLEKKIFFLPVFFKNSKTKKKRLAMFSCLKWYFGVKKVNKKHQRPLAQPGVLAEKKSFVALASQIHVSCFQKKKNWSPQHICILEMLPLKKVVWCEEGGRGSIVPEFWTTFQFCFIHNEKANQIIFCYETLHAMWHTKCVFILRQGVITCGERWKKGDKKVKKTIFCFRSKMAWKVFQTFLRCFKQIRRPFGVLRPAKPW